MLAAVVLLLVSSSPAKAVSPTSETDPQSQAHAAPVCAEMTAPTADEEYSCGMDFARLGRLDDAERAFSRGLRRNPGDARFAVELGGIAFRRKQYSEAANWLLKAVRLKPDDLYINDFLGTIFFLQGNTEAALKYWNRIGKPAVERTTIEPPTRVDPVLLDRALAFAPGEMLRLDELRTTEARLRGLGIFSVPDIRMAARDDGSFDAMVHVAERNGFGSTKWEALLLTFQGLAFQTITPEYYNLCGSATNITTLWRWDSEKRRISAALSGPVRRNPQWRYRLGLDVRNENWSVRNFSAAAGPTLGSLNLRRGAGRIDITSISSGRLSWSTGGEISYREYRGVADESALAPDLLLEGYSLKHTARLDYDLIRIPELHYVASTFADSQIGRTWAGQSHAYAKLQAGVRQTWSASTTGDDLEIQHELRAGRTVGNVSFDELFMLGLERDNNLRMRGHVGTQDGRKGNAPLGRHYFLSNLEFDKKVWSNGLVGIKLGPFVDTGKIVDPLSYLGSRKWLWDAGGQIRVRVLGISVGASYGRDLRSGTGAFYATVGK